MRQKDWLRRRAQSCCVCFFSPVLLALLLIQIVMEAEIKYSEAIRE
jgi:hypothetical protein